MRIIICGSIAGAGKDTASEYLVQKYGFQSFSFAAPIYTICREYFNMQRKDRWLLQQVGEKMREIDHEVWINYTFKQANLADRAAISDLRRKNEHLAALNHGYFPIRIVTKRDIAIDRILKRDGHCDVSLLDNESETGTREIPMYEIINNGTVEELYQQLDKLVTLMAMMEECKCTI